MSALEPIEQKELLRIARSTLVEYLAMGLIPPGKPHRKSLLEPAGAFVTLKTHGGRLRGCIGTFAATSPLYQTVQEMAVAAGTRDPRFPPVTEEELEGLHMEISVLSPREPLTDPNAVKVGVHGLCISRGYHHGVLLPQVPVEQRWDRETFLTHVCLKAGLPEDAWKDRDARLEVFTAQVFGESDPALREL
jgi:AmmeMemoRadiSam system protein A